MTPRPMTEAARSGGDEDPLRASQSMDQMVEGWVEVDAFALTALIEREAATPPSPTAGRLREAIGRLIYECRDMVPAKYREPLANYLSAALASDTGPVATLDVYQLARAIQYVETPIGAIVPPIQPFMDRAKELVEWYARLSESTTGDATVGES